jgi:hypothetical protein
MAELFRNEDIRVADVNDSVLAGGNLRRVAFVISAPPTSTVFIRFGGPAAANFGLSISPGTLPLLIDEQYVGTALREEVHVCSPGGQQNVYFLDIFSG